MNNASCEVKSTKVDDALKVERHLTILCIKDNPVAGPHVLVRVFKKRMLGVSLKNISHVMGDMYSGQGSLTSWPILLSTWTLKQLLSGQKLHN